MDWRPNNWKNPYSESLARIEQQPMVAPHLHNEFSTARTAYEAGADTILEALREMGYKYFEGVTVVQIPDKE